MGRDSTRDAALFPDAEDEHWTYGGRPAASLPAAH